MAEWRPWSVTLDRGILNHAALFFGDPRYPLELS
jgi:hypothetical protein